MTFVCARSTNTGGSSAAQTPNLLLPTSGAEEVKVNDLVLLAASTERGDLPAITCPTTGFTTGLSLAEGTTMAVLRGWKRVTAGDLGAGKNFFAAVAAGNRRQSLGLVVHRDVKDPVWVNGAYQASSSSVVTMTHPAATPAEANSTLVSIGSPLTAISPFTRTFAAASGWTERVDEGSSAAASNNAYTEISDRTLSGGAGASQAGHVVTDTTDGTGYRFAYIASTVVLAPQPADQLPPGWHKYQMIGKA